MVAPTTVVIPQWTKRISEDIVAGEDQLGLEGAAQSYQQYLTPGVISTTDHTRYYSFYCWVLSRFIHSGSRLLKDFRGTYFKRHEVALMMGCYSHHQEHGGLPGLIGAGVNQYKARGIWENGDPVSLDADYFQNQLGGFGQYYRPVMETMGLVRPPERSKLVYRLTRRGEELAKAFEQSIQATNYFQDLQSQGQLASLSHADAAEYGRRACLCAAALSQGTDRDLLLDTFFRFDRTGLRDPHVRRRLTLGLILDLVQKSGDVPFYAGVRPALYLGHFAPGRPYQPAEALTDWASRWRVVQVRHSYTAALQALWAVFLDRLRHETGQSFTFNDFMAWVLDHLPVELARLPVNDYLGSLTEAVGLSSSWVEAMPDFASACQIGAGLDEISLYQQLEDSNRDPSVLLKNALRILGQLFLRHYPLAQRRDILWLELADQPRLPLTQFLTEFAEQAPILTWTVSDALCWFYRDYLIGQHEVIALQKLRQNEYDTFKFYYRDGRFLWADNPADYREPLRLPGLRLFNGLSMLIDLGLVVADEAGCYYLTGNGETYLQRVLEAGHGH